MRLSESRFGLFWRCEGFPVCDITVGAHQEDSTNHRAGDPLGKPADHETRQCRIEAHKAFDQLWQGTHTRRSKAYRWLAKAMGMSNTKCHIANMNQEQCRKIIELCNQKIGTL